MSRKLFLDADNTILNTTKAFIETYMLIYGRKYMNKENKIPKWEKVSKYDFTDQIPSLTLKEKRIVFETMVLHDKLDYYEGAKEIINKLSKDFDIHIVSMCSLKTATLKGDKFSKDFPFVKFMPILHTNYEDKSIVDMRNGVFIDDVAKNLITSSADVKVCMKYNGIEMDINKDWNGSVITSWDEDTYSMLYDLLK